MRKFLTRFAIFLFFFFSLHGIGLYGQQATVHQKNALNAGVRNYTTFTNPNTNNKTEALTNNPGYEQHSEIGMLFAETPCDNCYELIGRRTEISKTFIKSGTNGRDILQQTSGGAMHYRGPNGEWLTIKSQLKPVGNAGGTFAAYEQEVPVVISPAYKFSSLGKNGQIFKYNNNLELIYAQFDGPEVSLGAADYSHYTAGDDGVYITNAWPGIDIEMFEVRGAIKTNFLINHAMPNIYHMGMLLIRDHLEMGALWAIKSQSGSNYGNLEVLNAAGEQVYAISAATAFQKAAPTKTTQFLPYYIKGNILDIAIPGEVLNRPEGAYPVVIDPLVTTATPSTVNGSTYSAGWTTGCVYNNPATVPAKTTITDVQFTFQYVTGGGALLNNGAYDFKLGTCRSPSVSTLYWNCNSVLSGTCDALLATIYAQISPCLPPPQCAAYDLNLTMNFYQNYALTAACNPAYIMAGTPLTITISGHTIDPGTVTATASSICQGQSTVLSATSLYGVPPYTYVWSPGGATGATNTVSPLSTTTYTVTATDACGNASAATKTINVNSVAPISGVTTLCLGGTSPLSCTPSGGTWASSNTSVATIGSSSGIVTGAGMGTATITYTSTAGCTATANVIVKPPVSPITGYMAVCQGSTTSLSDGTPLGTWSSGSPGVATIGSATGFASGISGGTATITYATNGAGCYATSTLTVNPLSAITGTLTICVGGSTSLTNAVPGGTWSTASSLITVGSATGVVNGISTGTALVTYTTPAGCVATTSVVINFLSPITGTMNVCQGNTTTLSNASGGGVWVSGSTGVATIGSSSGIVTGLAAGTTLISYTIPGGCFTSATVTVNPISPITGTPGVCVGGSTTLSDGAGPGTWSSSNTSVAIIGSSSGILTGVTVGTSTISYTSAAGCSAGALVNITLPTPTTGVATICQGSAATLSNSTPAGIWTSSNSAVASAGSSSGIISGINGGMVNITYATPAGCAVVTQFTVNPNPPITGITTLCVGTTTTLSSSAGSGSWSSGSTGVATIDASGGVVSGISAGTSLITYSTVAGCIATTTVTVNLPTPIMGASTVCQGAITTLTDAAPGGIWSSSSTGSATVGSSSGVVTGVSGGVVTISYTTATGCVATAVVTVNPIMPVTGTGTVCAGSITTLSDVTPGGTWSSSGTSTATVGSSSGVVTGISAGTVAIIYTTGAGCTTGYIVTVNPIPGPITGSTLICSTTTLGNSVSGGTWTCSNPSVALISAFSGLITPLGPGVVTITYTLTGGCFTTTNVTVDPVAPITGVTNVCQGSTATLSYPQPGGTWSSLGTSIATVNGTTGIVTGVNAGVTTINYTTLSGCVVSISLTVNPIMPITGAPAVCQGSTTTLSDGVPGGIWTSSNTSVANAGSSSGIVTGLSGGTTNIIYTTSAGCTATMIVTVNPFALITGASSVCAGNTTTLNNAVTGGSWSSTVTGVATIDILSGLVTGISAGTTTIDYTTAAGCIATYSFTVYATPAAISGMPVVCEGATNLLTNTLPGGVWSSSVPAVATIGSGTGLVSGISAGTTIISYTTTSGCYASTILTVNPLSATSGISAICVGGSATLANTTTGGGTWSSASTGIATVGSGTGLVTGVSAGISDIRFTTGAGCVAHFNILVNPLPSAIGGVPKVCVLATTTLTNTLSGGTWSISNPAVATIGAGTGIVTGVSPDTVTVTYTSSAGCVSTIVITVNPLPMAITGTTSICAGSTTTLNDATAGGYWSSGATAIATVGSVTGLVTGILAGITTIKYTMPSGCFVTTGFTVNAMPAAITGAAEVCEGGITTLYNSLPGGSWSSSATGIATIGAGTGVLSGVTAGIATITYMTPAGCYVVRNETVNPTPVISVISSSNPTTCVTNDGTITLAGMTAFATYTVNYLFGSTPVTVVLTANVSGQLKITGLAAGTYSNFAVTTTLACESSTRPGPVVLTLPPAPSAPVAANNSPICAGSALDLTATDVITGVTYSWTGPGGFSSTLQNPVLNPSTLAESGTYSVTATKLGCVSAIATTNVVIHPIPNISKITFTNPSTCQGSDGSITIQGLAAGVSYTVNYTFNGAPVNVTKVADGSGNVTITGLKAGTYNGFTVSSFTCLSNTAGPVTLMDPNPPQAPMIISNSPICSGRTLSLGVTNSNTGWTYDWTGPNGFSSNLRDPQVPNVTLADSGLYRLTVKYLNCPSSASVNVIAYPPVVLFGVTPSQTIAFGSSITLRASGAEFYLWSPNDGSLNFLNLDSTKATPQQTTVYVLEGFNRFGCADSAVITISVDYNIIEGVPNAFTPNGDGKNDVFKIENARYDKLVDFSIYNRWGQQVYHNNYDINQGWDGTFHGVQQDLGTYNYNIIVTDPMGNTKQFKGTVILVR